MSLTNYRREAVLPGLWHDYANLFPMLDAAGQDALRADVREHGVREPVILFSGRILDGRNRYMAARDLGLEFPVADFDGTEADALSYVLSTNLHRRHLTESQRSAVAAKLANMKPGNPDFSNPANLPDRTPAVSQAQAADMLNVSERSVRTAKSVIDHGTPALVAAVDQGDVSVSAAAAVATLPVHEQAALVAEGPAAVKAKARAIRHKTDATGAPKHRGGQELTREALEADLAGALEENAELKSKVAAQKDEIARLKTRLAEFEQGDDLGRALGNSQRQRDTLNGRLAETMQNLARADRQIRALKAENDRLRGGVAA